MVHPRGFKQYKQLWLILRQDLRIRPELMVRATRSWKTVGHWKKMLGLTICRHGVSLKEHPESMNSRLCMHSEEVQNIFHRIHAREREENN